MNTYHKNVYVRGKHPLQGYYVTICCIILVYFPYCIRKRRRIVSSLSVSLCTKVYPKVSGLGAWSEKCKWYHSLTLGAVVSIFYGAV